MQLKVSAGFVGLALALVGCGAGGAASANDGGSDYPKKPVRFLVPFAAGGPSSMTALAYASCLEGGLGQPILVENKAGGSGGIAMQELAGAKPDGYTLGLGTNGPLVMNPIVNDLGYSLADFSSVGVMAEMPTVLVVGSDSPYTDAQEFFAAAKAAPGKFSVAVPGATTSAAIELQRLKDEYGIEVTAVPASGNAEMTTNLLGGHVDALFITDHSDVAARIEDGSFMPLAISSPERAAWYPEVPTLAEVGFDDLVNAVSVFGVIGPQGLPEDVLSILEAELETCAADPGVAEQIGERFVPEEFAGSGDLHTAFTAMQDLYQPLLGQQ
ncbi:tripartite tricarboxylate transporter substrate binding protein [Paeniglutamicibacter sulfureus]|uniref:tripartite tricarboxylate transporter substrate binding protein n=1 Tax=Paeniglutamicibacter sulfureus TaxID=43666 RepID=UPI002665E84D|nr:tripartite tricarboxylate transporter substrate binding protein [Paeniglutamicibacter sulfureus]MDO2934225.1 tripartite tricarboxylate transporter substrate binding protein [Paeniglutamicibacter sulfureus]